MAGKDNSENNNASSSSASSTGSNAKVKGSGVKDFVEGAKGLTEGGNTSKKNSSGMGTSNDKSNGSPIGNAAKGAALGAASKIPGIGPAVQMARLANQARKMRNRKKNNNNLGNNSNESSKKLNPFNRGLRGLGFGGDKKEEDKKADTDSKENEDSENDEGTEKQKPDIIATGGNAAKTVVKRLMFKALMIIAPYLLGIILIMMLFLIIMIILMLVTGAWFNNNNKTNSDSVASAGNGTCTYNVGGKKVSNLKVRLLKCEGNTAVPGESLIDFEDYITGVVYQEVGDAPLEALKVQAIVARSFSLTRPDKMGGAYGLSLKDENGQWILSLRSCTNDQVFCNANRGCWSLRTGGQTSDSNPEDWPNCTVYSGEDKSKPWHRAPLAKDSKIRQAVEETKGIVLEDSKGNIVHTNFNNTNQTSWANMAKNGKDAFEILTKDYGKGKKLSTSNCTSGDGNSAINDASVAAITKWDQKTAWKNLIGKSTDERKPHVSQSTMNSRVTTIKVPMRKWKGSGSNPRTDTKKEMQSITVNKAIAPLWKAFFEDVYNNAPDFVIGSFDGCYVYRSVTGGGSLSAHAYGVACDINAGTPGNGYGTTSYSKSKWEKLSNNRAKYQVVYKGSKVVQIAHKYTLINGSDWSNGGNDAMHFSFIRDWTRSQIIACKGKTTC